MFEELVDAFGGGVEEVCEVCGCDPWPVGEGVEGSLFGGFEDGW